MLLVPPSFPRTHDRTGEEPSEYDANEAPFEARDIPDGPAARFEAYCAAWDECLQRIEVRPQVLRLICPLNLHMSECHTRYTRAFITQAGARCADSIRFTTPRPTLP